jgi:hypothetical protein
VNERLADLNDTASALGWALRHQLSTTRRGSLVEVAARLNRRSWKDLPVTDDFVVLAGESSMVDAHENLRRAVSAAQWDRLLQRGWVKSHSAGTE